MLYYFNTNTKYQTTKLSLKYKTMKILHYFMDGFIMNQNAVRYRLVLVIEV